LEALGFQVVEMPVPSEAPAREALEAAARAAGAVAAVRLVPSPTDGGIEVWIVDRVTGKTVLREVVAPDVSAGGAAARASTLAVRVVELLRASLLEMDAPHPSRGELPPTPELRAIARSAAPPRSVSPPPRPPATAPARWPRWPQFGATLGPALA